MTDYVEVTALKTFDNGSGLKTVDSAPFKVERGEANELKALGLVSFEDKKKPAADPEPEVAAEPEPEPEAVVKTTKRKGKSDDDNEK